MLRVRWASGTGVMGIKLSINLSVLSARIVGECYLSTPPDVAVAVIPDSVEELVADRRKGIFCKGTTHPKGRLDDKIAVFTPLADAVLHDIRRSEQMGLHGSINELAEMVSSILVLRVVSTNKPAGQLMEDIGPPPHPLAG